MLLLKRFTSPCLFSIPVSSLFQGEDTWKLATKKTKKQTTKPFPKLAESQLYHIGFTLSNKTRLRCSAASFYQQAIHQHCFSLLVDPKLPSKLFSLLPPQTEADMCGTQHPPCYHEPAPCTLQSRSPGKKNERFRKGLFPRTAVAGVPCPSAQVLGHCHRLQTAGKSQGPSDP